MGGRYVWSYRGIRVNMGYAETERLGLIPIELTVLLQWRAPTAAHTAYRWAFCLLGMSSQRVT